MDFQNKDVKARTHKECTHKNDITLGNFIEVNVTQTSDIFVETISSCNYKLNYTFLKGK